VKESSLGGIAGGAPLGSEPCASFSMAVTCAGVGLGKPSVKPVPKEKGAAETNERQVRPIRDADAIWENIMSRFDMTER